MIEIILVAAAIILTGLVGCFLRLLTISGSAAAVLVGLAVFAGFGVKGLILLGVFFATSSFWSRYKSTYKKAVEEKLAKGAVRDWRQVLANGGFAAFLGIINYFFHNSIWMIGFAVCIASANSDTWASEIGPLSRKDPIYVRSLKRVEKGTSGAVSLLGTAAAFLGSFLIAAAGFCLFHINLTGALIIFIFGFIGNIIDTLAGAFSQKVYTCAVCGKETEKEFHCLAPSIKIKGFSFMDNDMVNFFAGFASALLAMAVARL